MATSDFTRNTQIIEYLCSISAFVVGCCCEFPAPSTNGQNPPVPPNPPAAGSLFLALNALYPTVWTDVQVLVDLLEDGATRGRYKRLVDSVGDTYWYIDLFMIRQNYANTQYLPFCSAIKNCPRTEKTFPSI